MATVKDIKIGGYCDSINKELSDMKMKISVLREDLRRTYEEDNELFRTNDRHLNELSDAVENKLQILMGSCPIDWKETVRMEKAAEAAEGFDFV